MLQDFVLQKIWIKSTGIKSNHKDSAAYVPYCILYTPLIDLKDIPPSWRQQLYELPPAPHIAKLINAVSQLVRHLWPVYISTLHKIVLKQAGHDNVYPSYLDSLQPPLKDRERASEQQKGRTCC